MFLVRSINSRIPRAGDCCRVGLGIRRGHFSTGCSAADRKKAAIYTRTGDKGTSSLYNGERREKHDGVFEALGNTDELNAAIGVAKEHCDLVNNGLSSSLATVQSRMLDIGSAVATPRQNTPSEARIDLTSFDEIHVKVIEEWIDDLDATLPQLTNFILPSGGLASAQLHVARAVCRRTERSVVPLVMGGAVEPAVQKYLNRLSDYLFTPARVACMKEGNEETVYQKEK